ncbi:acyl-CoA dehydrogenase family protein [Nocardioides sp. 616]|uniref:acyl-CoA dehydrogenase family protein n=1 Tax=Nocardioides sp. 616 TaxID=2268090 RepID=UPI000CE3069B|nr:acyl-CoA dehydrogenase family protein [Nocardioides sp. 616]
MDFSLDDEQVALRDAVRSLVTKTYGDFEQRRRTSASEPGYDESLWRQLAEMGVLGLPFAEDDGGMGAGPVEVGLVAAELGRVLAPEPFLASVVLAGGAVAAAGTADQRAELLGALAAGERLLALAHEETVPVTASPFGDGWRLNGTKEPVLHGAGADLLVVSAALADGGTGLFLVEGSDADIDGYRTYDGGRAARVRLEDAPATVLGEPGADQATTLAGVLAAARLAACHEALGGMEAALAATTGYLKSRKQFGVTLNTFQALTFRAADMYVSLELTRSIVDWATMVLATGDATRAAEASARAALQVSRAGRHIGQEAIQLHGGIGMTAEYLVGNITAHLTVLDHLLGDGQQQLVALMAGVGDYEALDPLAPTMRSTSSQ